MTDWQPRVNSPAWVEGKLPCMIRDRNERGMWLCDLGASGKAWLPGELLEPQERRESEAFAGVAAALRPLTERAA